MAIAAILLAGGCDLLRPPPPPQAQPSQSSPPAQPPTPPEKPQPAAPILPPPRPEPRPKAPAADPAVLSGLDEAAVGEMLGVPYESRVQGAARVLVWHSESCVFDVIFFLDVKEGAWRVLTWAMEDGPPKTATIQACFGTLKGTR